MSGGEDPHTDPSVEFLVALDSAAAVLQHHGRAPDGSTEASETAARLLAAALAIADANEIFCTVDPYDSGNPTGPAQYPDSIRGRLGLHMALQHAERYMKIESSFATAARAYLQAVDRPANRDPIHAIRSRARAATDLAKRRARKHRERERRLAAG